MMTTKITTIWTRMMIMTIDAGNDDDEEEEDVLVKFVL